MMGGHGFGSFEKVIMAHRCSSISIRGLPAKVILKQNPFVSLIRFRKYIVEYTTCLARLIFIFATFLKVIYYSHVTFFFFLY